MIFAQIVMGIFLMQALCCASFDKKALSSHIRALASDEFDGRAPMTDGETITLSYLEQEFSRMGIKQLPHLTSYRQAVPLARIKTDIVGPITASGISLKPHEDIVITSESKIEAVTINNVPLVFVGYGITADEFGWDDYKNIDVTNKIVVSLVSDPGLSSPTLFKGNDTTYYGRWIYKLEEARRRGALGALIIHETEAAGYGFHVVQQKNSQLVLNDQNQRLLVQGWLSLDAATKIFAEANSNFEAMKHKALSPGAAVTNLGSLTMKAKNTVTLGQSYNMCGLIEGENSQEYGVISAHWDHLGSLIDQQGNKSIYRGAIDNGTGLASLLELGRYFSQRKPKKNLLLCSFTAEEQGLLGAKYFVENPPIPLTSITGMLNFDCLNVGQKTNTVTFYGPKDNKLYPLLRDQAAKQGRSVIKDPQGSKGYFYRSDHFPFVLQGVPALLFMDLGISNPDYLHHHYHQPSDAHDTSWPLDGMVQDLHLFKNVLERL